MSTVSSGPKLSKTFFMGLTDGVYLASNVGYSPTLPAFGEVVVPAADREKQWQRIKEARVDQQLCHVYRNKNDFDELSKKWDPDSADKK